MSHLISLADAADMTAQFRSDRETILASGYQNQNILPKCETFDKSEVDSMLGQTGCTQLRIYYGMDEDHKVHAILVGANSSDEDIIFPNTDNSIILENSIRCPYDCPQPSELNS